MAKKRQNQKPGTIPGEDLDLKDLEGPEGVCPPVDLSPEEVSRLAAPASRVFDRIAEAWKLTEEQRRSLLEPGMEATVEGLRRVSLLMQVHTYLHTLLPESADGWVHRPNSNQVFKGRTAFDLMASDGIQGMTLVRNHLGAWAEGQG